MNKSKPIDGVPKKSQKACVNGGGRKIKGKSRKSK